jgi:hypothetical protein
MCIADMSIDTFVAESLLLRVMKLTEQGAATVHKDILDCYLYDAADRVLKNGKDAINAISALGGDEQRMILMGLRRFTKAQPFNSKAARRRIAEHLVSNDRYAL